MNYDPLKSLQENPEWTAVEKVIEEYLIEMFDIRKIDTNLPAEQFKTECMARILAGENVYDFWKTNKFIQKRKEDIPFTFR